MGTMQTDKLKAAPVHALRAVFSRVGQLLLAADKIKTQARDRTADASHAIAARQAASRRPRPQPRRADVSRTGAESAAQARADSRWRSLDKTGNVRLLTAAELAESVNDRPVARPVRPQPAVAPAADRWTDTAVEADMAVKAAEGNGLPPIANYDALSLPSLRARLRSLDAAQLARLAAYERAHAARAEVISMFENRIAKLRAGG
jgi:hypothetical protein